MNVGYLLRKRRQVLGATLEDIALEAGIDASNLSRIERGIQQPSSALLKRIATALGVYVGELYGELGEPENAEPVIAEEDDTHAASAHDSQKILRQIQQLDAPHRELTMQFIKLLTKAQHLP